MLTQEGGQAWATLNACARQLRRAGVGGVVYALDLEAALAYARAAGHDLTAAALLLPMAEEGLIAGIAARGGNDPDQNRDI